MFLIYPKHEIITKFNGEEILEHIELCEVPESCWKCLVDLPSLCDIKIFGIFSAQKTKSAFTLEPTLSILVISYVVSLNTIGT